MSYLIRTASVLIGFGLIVTTVGCANPLDQLVNTVSEGAVKEMTGLEDVSIDTGGGAKLPEAWPDVPTPSSDPTASFSTEDGLMVMFDVGPGEFESMKSQFEASGWSADNEWDMSGEMQSVTYSKDDITVMLSSVADDDIVRLQYLVITSADSSE